VEPRAADVRTASSSRARRPRRRGPPPTRSSARPALSAPVRSSASTQRRT
jgi:hypothetical protein